MDDKIVTRNFHLPNSHHLATYEANEGYQGLKKALSMKPEEVIAHVKDSGLRGRGGAGFPTGMKWTFLGKNTGKPAYLCVNADEGEPGTFKDREILRRDPHMLLEGTAIASYALGVKTAYVYLRGEFMKEGDLLLSSIEAAKKKNYLGKRIFGYDFDLEIVIHMGAGAYICGEETALIESLEGKKGLPRIKPPFPAVRGVWGCPTVVNNVETITAIVPIINDGGDVYSKIGSGKSTGTKLISSCGN